MAITGIVFDNQVPTAKGIRSAFHSSLSDGIVDGCSIVYSGTTVTIGSGFVNVAGGIFKISGSEEVILSGSSGAYARIKAVIDLTRSATTSEFNQVYFTVDYANTADGFSALTQGDINNGADTLYEAEFCVVLIENGSIASIVRTAVAEAKILYGDTLPDDAPEGTLFLLKV